MFLKPLHTSHFDMNTVCRAQLFGLFLKIGWISMNIDFSRLYVRGWLKSLMNPHNRKFLFWRQNYIWPLRQGVHSDTAAAQPAVLPLYHTRDGASVGANAANAIIFSNETLVATNQSEILFSPASSR